jgi:molybdopterin synthase catalytic subunit
MSIRVLVSVQTEDFDVSSELAAMRAGDAAIGAVVNFVGLVRDRNDGAAVAALTLEHYPGMTERALEKIVVEAGKRWSLNAVRVIHRVGTLQVEDQIVLVATASPHRGDAFEACAFIMDYLKTRAPFWKREDTPGGARWVEAKDADDDAAARWDTPAP